MQVKKTSFDPMAAAVDWFDAYCTRDIEAIVRMHSDAAVVDCVGETVSNKERLRAFWKERLNDGIPSELRDLRPVPQGASISFEAPRGLITAILEFDAEGRIAHMKWDALRKR